MVTVEYIAGFFDGEGCITYQKRGTNKGYYRIFMAQSGNEGLKLLTAIRDFLHMGKIYKLKRSLGRLGKKDAWQLSIFRKEEVMDFKHSVGLFCKIKDFSIIK